MKIKSNFLRMYRKRYSVLLNDMAYLLNMNSGNLSRYEKGHRDPTPEVLLTYYILFDANVVNIFHQQYSKLREQLLVRSRTLIEQLKVEQPPKFALRIKYLSNMLTRLINEKHE